MNPIYILKGQEPSTQSKPQKKLNAFSVIGIILLVLYLLSFMSGKGGVLAAQRSSMLIPGLIFLNLGITSANKKIREPFEIQFYPDYLVVYRARHHFDGTNPRKQFEKIYYQNLRACVWDRVAKQLVFVGTTEITATNYDKKGNLENGTNQWQIPEHVCKVGTGLTMKTDYKMEIEANTPVRVEVR